MSVRQRLLYLRGRRAGRRLAECGHSTVLVPPVVLNHPERIRIGDRTVIHERAFFSVVTEHYGRRYDPQVRIGSGVSIGHGLWLSCVGEIVVEDDVLMGHNIVLADSFHEYFDVTTPIIRQPMAEPRPVRIGRGAQLGPHVAVLAGVTVGAGSFVGANSVVTRDVPPHSVAAGNPARLLRRYDAEAGAWRDVEAGDDAPR